ncbi:hypothetical protein GTQ99_16360 [Kineococcus sp. T13]|uniref:hypothetical protein n=1 Tax=Kineococcus vitellinus TaxID=2696565 RepID=UPI0014126A83|nr:hypothetical protein [Kineococcus vitellinus]NAZ76982.1 hypothetical protein [Kineococcus vitellinus]
MRFIVLTGLTGSGKSDMLCRLATAGEQVIDLEALAAHRGSSFGRIGITRPQPSQASFDAQLHDALEGIDPDRPVWLEDEGPHIGPLWLPRELTGAIRDAATVELVSLLEERVRRLVATYGRADPAELIEATQRIRRRLGNARADRIISHFHAGHPDQAIRVLLKYFDEGYVVRSASDARTELPAHDRPALLIKPQMSTRPMPRDTRHASRTALEQAGDLAV